MNDMKEFIESILGPEIEQFDYEAGGQKLVGWKKYVEWTDPPDEDRVMKIVEPAWRACHDRDVRLLVGPTVLNDGRGKYVDSWDASLRNQNPPAYVQIFALPALPVIDIIELFEVGSHNDMQLPASFALNAMEMLRKQMSPEERKWLETPEGKKVTDANRMKLEQRYDGAERWPKVRASLGEVFKIAPFEIQSAHAAGLEATFVNPVGTAYARQVGKIILEIPSDVVDVFEHEWEELGVLIPDRDTPEIPDFEASMAKYIITTGKFKLWWD